MLPTPSVTSYDLIVTYYYYYCVRVTPELSRHHISLVVVKRTGETGGSWTWRPRRQWRKRWRLEVAS